MKRLIYHIIRLTLVLIPVMLTVANARAQIVVSQCDTMEFSVVSRPSIDESHFVWGIYNSSPDPVDVLDPATTLDPALYFVNGQYAGRTVQVTGLNPGVYYVRIEVWDEVSCTNNVEMYVLEVIEHELALELTGDSACIGDPVMIKLVFSGTAPYDAQLTYTNVDGTQSIYLNGVTENEIMYPIMDPLPVGETEFKVMTISDGCIKNYALPDPEKAKIVIYPNPTNSRIYQVDK